MFLHISLYSFLFSASLVGSCSCLRVGKIFHVQSYRYFDMQKNVDNVEKKLQARTLCVVPRMRWLLSAKSVPGGSSKSCFWSLWRILLIVFGHYEDTINSFWLLWRILLIVLIRILILVLCLPLLLPAGLNGGHCLLLHRRPAEANQ